MSSYDRLRSAFEALYYSAYWHADRPVDELALWTAAREAAGITPGQSAIRLGSDLSETGLLRQLVLDCQNDLATYIVPDSGITEHDVVNTLLGRLDGPQSRAALSAPSATRLSDLPEANELASALKDAARYRWWRSKWVGADGEFDVLNDYLAACDTPGACDAAIDAGIKEKP